MWLFRWKETAEKETTDQRESASREVDMGRLRILTQDGDATVAWDRELVENSDPEAVAAVREAERIFRRQMERGATAFDVQEGTLPRRLDEFDRDAEQIVIVPRVVGG